MHASRVFCEGSNIPGLSSWKLLRADRNVNLIYENYVQEQPNWSRFPSWVVFQLFVNISIKLFGRIISNLPFLGRVENNSEIAGHTCRRHNGLEPTPRTDHGIRKCDFSFLSSVSASIAGSVQSNSDFIMEKLEGAGKEFADEVHLDASAGRWIQQLTIRKTRKIWKASA